MRERERGSNLRRQRPASPTAQVLVAQTTRAVPKNWLRDQLLGIRSDWHGRLGVGKREKHAKETSGRGSQDEPAQDKKDNGRWTNSAKRQIDVGKREVIFCTLFLSLPSRSSQPPIDRVSPNVSLKACWSYGGEYLNNSITSHRETEHTECCCHEYEARKNKKMKARRKNMVLKVSAYTVRSRQN